MLLFPLFLFWRSASACEIGLTQLRQRNTLALMRCVPTLPGQADPCIVQTGGRMAVCQKYGQDYVCCGSQELLVQILAGRPTIPDIWNNGQHFDYNVIRIPPIIATREDALHVITTPPPALHARTSMQPRKLSMSTPAPQSTLISLLSEPIFQLGNYTNSFRLAANVVAVRDGRCTIIINTGMPHQKSEIIQNLASAGIRSSDINFVVISSAFPQFIGNLNLFPDAQVLMERHFLYKDHVIRGGIDQDVHIELCSSNTFVVSTPGPTQNAVSLIARHVPSMGTVAITGALFVKDDSLTRVDDDFSSNTIQLLQSRAEIVCQSDWILPAHSPAFPVTKAMRQMANCA